MEEGEILNKLIREVDGWYVISCAHGTKKGSKDSWWEEIHQKRWLKSKVSAEITFYPHLYSHDSTKKEYMTYNLIFFFYSVEEEQKLFISNWVRNNVIEGLDFITLSEEKSNYWTANSCGFTYLYEKMMEIKQAMDDTFY